MASCGIPGSILKEKSQSIAYHFVRQEGAARDEWQTSYVNTHDNEADLLTKLLPSGEKQKVLLQSYCTTSSEPDVWENNCGMNYEAD